MLNIGPQELLVILIIALLVVGPQRLPELGRSIGRWMRELRNAQEEVKRTIRAGLDEPNGASSTGASADRPAAPGAGNEVSGEQSPTPTVSSTPDPDEMRDISRSLGRSLGQIRRAREEVQRSFRVDLDGPERKMRARGRATDSPVAEPTEPSQSEPQERGPTESMPKDPDS